MHTMVTSSITRAVCLVVTDLLCQDQLMGTSNQLLHFLGPFTHPDLCLYRFGPVYLDYSPRRVMYSGWVGDDDPTFDGLESALKSYLQSAWAGMYTTCC